MKNPEILEQILSMISNSHGELQPFLCKTLLEISVARKFRAENTKGEPQNTEKEHHFEKPENTMFLDIKTPNI